jgi:hypothetical protein
MRSAAEQICTFRCAPDLWARFKMVAEASNRSASAEVRMLVERHVAGSAERELRALAAERVGRVLAGVKR